MAHRSALFATCCILALSACTTHVYTARMDVQDSQGEQRQAVLYWTNTSPLIGKRKAGPAVLMTECGARLRFDERPEGIVFRGTPGQDKPVNQATTSGADFECGRFTAHQRFIDISDGKVPLTILCQPVSGEFSVDPRKYIAARPAPYEFDVTSEKHWSLIGSHEGIIPPPPDCQVP